MQVKELVKTKQELRMDAIEEAFKKFAQRMDRFAEKVRAYDPKNMLEMETRHTELSARFQLLIEKVTVATEVGYYARHQTGITEAQRAALLGAALWALDQPDVWWKGHDQLSVKQWAKRCLDAYRGDKLLKVTSDAIEG